MIINEKINASENNITVGQLMDVMPTIEQGDKWISDEIINHYFDMLAAQTNKVIPISSSLAEQISKGQQIITAFEQIMPIKMPIYQQRKHLWPVFVKKNHWILIVVDHAKSLTIYDSRNEGSKYREVADRLIDYYAEHDDLFKDARERVDVNVADVACESNNGRECGIFVMMRAAMVAEVGTLVTYKDFRTRLVLEIITGQLVDNHPDLQSVEKLEIALQKLSKDLESKMPQQSKILRMKHLATLEKIAEGLEREKWPMDWAKWSIQIREACQCGYNTLRGHKTTPPTAAFVWAGELHTGVSTSGSDTERQPEKLSKSPAKLDEAEKIVVNVSPNAHVVEEGDDDSVEDARKRLDEILSDKELINQILSEDPVNRYYKKVKSETPAALFATKSFRRIMTREMIKIAKRKPLSNIMAQAPTKEELRDAKKTSFKKLISYGKIPKGTSYKNTLIDADMKQFLAVEGYETGMSGDERAEPVFGPPLTKETKEHPIRCQCRICERTFSSVYNAVNHVLVHCYPAHFQKRDVFNKTHAPVNLKALGSKPPVAALYVQHAPKKEPRNRYNRSDWPELMATTPPRRVTQKEDDVSTQQITEPERQVDNPLAVFDGLPDDLEEGEISTSDTSESRSTCGSGDTQQETGDNKIQEVKSESHSVESVLKTDDTEVQPDEPEEDNKREYYLRMRKRPRMNDFFKQSIPTVKKAADEQGG